jgi:hypothetical protein
MARRAIGSIKRLPRRNLDRIARVSIELVAALTSKSPNGTPSNHSKGQGGKDDLFCHEKSLTETALFPHIWPDHARKPHRRQNRHANRPCFTLNQWQNKSELRG